VIPRRIQRIGELKVVMADTIKTECMTIMARNRIMVNICSDDGEWE
jgi:hypothetical protein